MEEFAPIYLLRDSGMLFNLLDEMKECSPIYQFRWKNVSYLLAEIVEFSQVYWLRWGMFPYLLVDMKERPPIYMLRWGDVHVFFLL